MIAVEHQLLLDEYRLSAEVCNHIDNLRNVLTSFFLTLIGGVLLAASFVLKGEVNEGILGTPAALLASTTAGVGLLGLTFVATLGRMRRIQTERYRTMNGIADALLTSHRALFPYSNATLAKDGGGQGLARRSTGSYFWTLAVIGPTAALFGLAAKLVIADIAKWWTSSLVWLVALGVSLGVGTAIDALYFKLSRPN